MSQEQPPQTPTATLQFPLPEYEEEFQLAASARKLWCVIWELDQHILRAVVKYDAGTANQIKYYEKLREELWELLNSHGVGDLF